MLYKSKLGHFGEKLASEILRGKGYLIISQNYRTRFGEIDIIAKDQRELVFIEVKCRTSLNFGRPYEAITKDKLKRMYKMAQIYLANYNIAKQIFRFDAVSILLSPGGEVKNVEILKNLCE